jgi:hypothetical protein
MPLLDADLQVCLAEILLRVTEDDDRLIVAWERPEVGRSMDLEGLGALVQLLTERMIVRRGYDGLVTLVQFLTEQVVRAEPEHEPEPGRRRASWERLDDEL